MNLDEPLPLILVVDEGDGGCEVVMVARQWWSTIKKKKKKEKRWWLG
jgi:hypothetical protein